MHQRMAAFENHPATVWLEVERGFWVGSTDASFVGTVELRDGLFHARGRAAAHVGDFPARPEAQAAIESAGLAELPGPAGSHSAGLEQAHTAGSR